MRNINFKMATIDAHNLKLRCSQLLSTDNDQPRNFYGSQICVPTNDSNNTDELAQEQEIDDSQHFSNEHADDDYPPPSNTDRFRANLIEEVRKYQCVWDVKCRAFKNIEFKRRAWLKIAAELRVEGKLFLLI